MKMHSIPSLVLGLAILFTSSLSFAQATATSAQLNGSVKDPSGSVIVKATITLRSVDTNQTYNSTSNQAGYYILSNVPPGNYELTATSTGFGKYTQPVSLRVAQVATIDISLHVAGANVDVEVKTDAPVIEPSRTEVSN